MSEQDQIRWAKKGDAERIRELWELCFGDSAEWCDWEFANRYADERTLCLLREGSIVADMQIQPYPYRLRGTVFDAMCLNGVATHPDWRRRGLMGELMRRLMPEMRDRGIYVIFHTPVRLDQYFAYDHLETVKRNVFNIPARRADVRAKAFEGGAGELLPLYLKYAAGFSGMVERTEKEMALRLADARSDGGEVMVTDGGYAIYYRTNELTTAIELVYINDDAKEALIDSLLSFGLPIELTLPESEPAPPDSQLAENTYNVLRITDVASVLRAMKPQFSARLRVTDAFLPNNDGVFLCTGERTDEPADVTIDIGRFGQWISGYKPIKELAEGDGKAIEQLERALPAIKTYTIEPY